MSEPKILDGKWLSKQIERSLAERVETYMRMGQRAPGLGVLLVGDNPASLAYVGRKEKVAKRCGFVTKEVRLPASITSAELKAAIEKLNRDCEIDGILLQLPLPDHLNANEMIDTIDPKKDADGLHPLNQGRLLRGSDGVRPCTPAGVMRLIDLAESAWKPGEEISPQEILPKADLSGKRAIVIGRSILVGKAAALLLLERNATVSIGHSRTSDLPALTREADIVVAAVGKPQLVGREWVKKGATVIDVGINRTDEGVLVGDVDFNSVSGICSAITPVPGGVGPMTVIMLMQNTLKAYDENLK